MDADVAAGRIPFLVSRERGHDEHGCRRSAAGARRAVPRAGRLAPRRRRVRGVRRADRARPGGAGGDGARRLGDARPAQVARDAVRGRLPAWSATAPRSSARSSSTRSTSRRPAPASTPSTSPIAASSSPAPAGRSRSGSRSQTFGVDAFRAVIDRALDLTLDAQRRIEADPRLELVSPASLGVLTFRRRGAPGRSPAEVRPRERGDRRGARGGRRRRAHLDRDRRALRDPAVHPQPHLGRGRRRLRARARRDRRRRPRRRRHDAAAARGPCQAGVDLRVARGTGRRRGLARGHAAVRRRVAGAARAVPRRGARGDVRRRRGRDRALDARPDLLRGAAWPPRRCAWTATR